MDLKNDYNKLYQHWLKEVQELELTPFSQDLFDEYKKSVKNLKKYKVDKEDKIKNELLNSYKKNFEYLYSDFLKMREIKIVNAALSLQEIDMDKVTEAEKLFFQNLVSSIKGFKKLKELSIHENQDSMKFETTNKGQGLEESLKISNDSKLEEPHVEMEFQTNKIVESISINNVDEEIYDYTLIRFLKKTPPLVGIDLKNYGPFEKEDIALIPYKNAKILLSEKFAEKIDISH